MEIVPFQKTKLDWFLLISQNKREGDTLLPEHYYEVAGLPNAEAWLDRAEQEKLNPLELRREIRKHQQLVQKEEKIQINIWAKTYQKLQKEIEKLPSNQKSRIKDYIFSELNR